MYAELRSFSLADFLSLLTMGVLKEGLAGYVQDEYIVAEGIEVGSMEESPKKKRRNARRHGRGGRLGRLRPTRELSC